MVPASQTPPSIAALFRLLVLALLLSGPSIRAAQPPNVIVIVADDLGWSDLTVQGATDLKTPHIDALARNGVRFTSGYVTAPVCSPSRAGLFTGRYQQRFGHETNPGTLLETNSIFGLPLTERTIANRLHPLGYTNGWVGKSHLGGAPQYHPVQRGFDEFFGFIQSHHDYFNPPGSYLTDIDPILRYTTKVDETNYLTAAFARECVSFIARHTNAPFFLYAPFNAAHFPLQAPTNLLARFDSNDFQGNLNRYTNAAMMAGLDDAVGAIVATLRSLKLDTNTLIFFTSDNGGATDFGSINTPLRGGKSDLYEGGIRVPFIMNWPGRLPTNQVRDGMVSTLDILPTAIAAAGGTVPAAWRLDGVNLLPYAGGETADPPHTNLFWRIETNGALDDDVKDGVRAIRADNWKLVKMSIRDSWELYDLANDLSETNNLASARPELVQQLITAYESWSAEMPSARWARNDPDYLPPAFIREDIRLGSTNVSYLDPEFLPGGNQVAFQDGQGALWVGDVDPVTGWLSANDGRSLPVDSALAPLTSSLNQLEWGTSTNVPAIFYTKPADAGRRQLFRARVENGLVVTSQLTASLAIEHFAVRATQEPTNGSVRLLFNAGNAAVSVPVWSDELTPMTTNALPLPAPGLDNGSWLPGGTSLVFVGRSPLLGTTQLARLDVVTGQATVLTDDAGEKSEPCGFLAPELNGELLYAAVVDQDRVAIYRDVHNPGGLLRRIATLRLPAGAPTAHLHSLRPLVGGRGFNGVSYFTCAAQRNDDPLNPGFGAIYLLGLGPDTNNLIVRRLDEGSLDDRLADRRDPKTFVGEREVFCYFSLFDGANNVQLRLAKTGLRFPDFPEAPSGFTALNHGRSFTAGTNDSRGLVMAGTETLNLVTHRGRLYSAQGGRNSWVLPRVPAQFDPHWSGAQILVKDSASSRWRVDGDFPNHLSVESLAEFAPTTLGGPTVLVAGMKDIFAFGSQFASARMRVDLTGEWVESHVTTTDAAEVISFGSHADPGSPVNYLYAGLSNGQIHRGGLDASERNLTWNTDAELRGVGPVTSFAECDGNLYAACGLLQTNPGAPATGGLYRRREEFPFWQRVYQWPHPVDLQTLSEENRLMRGLTAVPGPHGTNNKFLLVGRSWPGVIERIEPGAGHAVTVELDVRDFLARRWQDDRVRTSSVTVAYNGFTAATNPVTGELVHLVGIWVHHPDPAVSLFNGAHFLTRHLDGTYEVAAIPNDLAGELRTTRCVIPSPFEDDERGILYFGGYDVAGQTSTNTAWIIRGEWSRWPQLAIRHPAAAEWLLEWPITDSGWRLESSQAPEPGAEWQAVPEFATRSRSRATLGGTVQTPARFFRLRQQ